MPILAQSLELNLEVIEDPALHAEIELIIEGLSEIETEVLPVGRARNSFSPLLERLHSGGACLVAERGVVKDADETTVMMSLETLQRLMVTTIAKTIQHQAERRPLSEMLAGLKPVPASMETFEVEYAAGAQDADDAEPGVEL